MGDRLRIFGLVALLGFMAGVIAQVTADYIIPWLMVVLPALINVKWIVSGFAGAALTLVLVSVWAYMTGNRDRTPR
jgi:chromate transport protein ChrA